MEPVFALDTYFLLYEQVPLPQLCDDGGILPLPGYFDGLGICSLMSACISDLLGRSIRVFERFFVRHTGQS